MRKFVIFMTPQSWRPVPVHVQPGRPTFHPFERMKITGAEAIHISVPYGYGAAPNTDVMPWRNMETLFIKVETDEGVIGWGEAFGFGACGVTRVAFETGVAPLVLGRDPSDIGSLTADLAHKLHNYGRNGPMSYALSGLDIALWDIAGKVAGEPLYRMLGGSSVERVAAYASLLRYGSPDLIARHAKEAAGSGYKSIKLHEVGVAEIGAARAAVGPDIDLMVDTNCPWTTDEAVATARRLAPFDLMWLEEPIWPPDDYEALAEVRRAGGVPVAAGENAGSVSEIMRLIETAHVDYTQPSVTKIGGITEMRRVIALAAARDCKIVPHSPYFGPGLIATVHICASLPARPPVERLYCDLEASPLGDAINANDGCMTVPKAPGLGVTIDEVIVAKYRVA